MTMRRLLLLALVGMGLSKMYFGSFVPPNLKLNAPGFDILRGNSNARPPRSVMQPEHRIPHSIRH